MRMVTSSKIYQNHHSGNDRGSNPRSEFSLPSGYVEDDEMDYMVRVGDEVDVLTA